MKNNLSDKLFELICYSICILISVKKYVTERGEAV